MTIVYPANDDNVDDDTVMMTMTAMNDDNDYYSLMRNMRNILYPNV